MSSSSGRQKKSSCRQKQVIPQMLLNLAWNTEYLIVQKKHPRTFYYIICVHIPNSSVMVWIQSLTSPRPVAQTKLKKPSRPNYWTIVWETKRRIHTFPNGISVKWNANSLVHVLNSSRLTITVTQSASSSNVCTHVDKIIWSFLRLNRRCWFVNDKRN